MTDVGSDGAVERNRHTEAEPVVVSPKRTFEVAIDLGGCGYSERR